MPSLPIRFFALLCAFSFLQMVVRADDVSDLVGQLKDKDETTRLKAAKELGKLKSKARDAIPALTLALNDTDEDVRAVAKRSLEGIKEALNAEDRDAAMKALEPLTKAVRSKDQKIRLDAIEKLAKLGPDGKAAREALIESGMMDPSKVIREAASFAMEKIDPLLYRLVQVVLIDNALSNRLDAAVALSKMGADAEPSLPAVRLLFTQCMSNKVFSPYDALVFFKIIWKIDPEDQQVRRGVLAAVGAPDVALASWALRTKSGRVGAFTRQHALDLNIEFASLSWTVRRTAVATMHEMQFESKHKYAALMTAFGNSDDRIFIIEELAKLGPDAKGAIPTLTKLKLDTNLTIRDSATRALDAINKK